VRSAALIAVLLVALAASPVVPRTASVSAPSLTPGDTWTYRTNTRLGAGLYLDGHVTLTVVEHGNISVEGAAYNAYRMSVSGTGTAAGNFSTDFGTTPASGSWVLTGQEVFESAGLKTIMTVLDLEANGTLHTSPVQLPFRLSVQNTTTYRIVEDGWRFPHAVGDSAVVRLALNFTEDFRLFYGLPTTPVHTAGIVWSNVTYTLETETTVDTPAGTFDSFRISSSYPDGTRDRAYYAPAAGSDVRRESYTGNDTSPVSTTELVTYRYQALEPARFFGLTTSDWIIVVALIAVASVPVIVLFRWQTRSKPPPGPPPPPNR